MPAFPIVDSHVHLYDVERFSFAWMRDKPKLSRSYGLVDFDAARGAVEVEAIVFAEVWTDPGQYLDEAAWVQALADRDQRLRGIVAHAPVERGAAIEADLDRLQENRCLRGIRRLIEIERDPGFCLEPGFIAGVQTVGRRGLVFDICIKHWQMLYAIELVRRCPDVQFVLDHIGKPGIKYGFKEPWWSQIAELARFDNVVAKISGVIAEADPAHWTSAQIEPYVDHAIKVFGFDRVMFGSDWTVSELTHSYEAWPALVDGVIAGASQDEQRKLYRETANRIYRLGL
jgi:L-fuconolactonase